MNESELKQRVEALETIVEGQAFICKELADKLTAISQAHSALLGRLIAVEALARTQAYADTLSKGERGRAAYSKQGEYFLNRQLEHCTDDEAAQMAKDRFLSILHFAFEEARMTEAKYPDLGGT